MPPFAARWLPGINGRHEPVINKHREDYFVVAFAATRVAPLHSMHESNLLSHLLPFILLIDCSLYMACASLLALHRRVRCYVGCTTVSHAT